MCITAPARIIELGEGAAIVDMNGARRRASTLVVPDVAPGDWVIVGAGTILRRLDPRDARALAGTINDAIASAGASPALHREGDPR